jgi:glycosyltransferase involved in cell wall biosynthesis
MKIIAKLKAELGERKVRYILVTRKDSPVGWKLDDLALSLGITKNLTVFNRGVPEQDLWALYGAADAYLQPSKAEGLGMPVLEAMACNVPCVATNTGALHELLDGRGYLVPAEYEFVDVWGNSKRSMIDIDEAALCLKTIANATEMQDTVGYIISRPWVIPVNQVHDKITEIISKGITDEQKN